MENTQIGKYKIIKLIGEGGMASVYEAEHVKLGNKAAVKILDEILIKKRNIKERFENEAKIMASLQHPNIVRVIDYEETPESLAIIMELIEGKSLTDYIKEKGKLQAREAVELQKILLNTFAYAHHKGIVHRDVKPSNIIIETDKNNNPKILDFGIAKLLQSDANLTNTGMQMGTPLYMSPEQVKDSKSIDHRSDIYSLGVVLYYMLSGNPPYNNSEMSNFDIFNKIVNEPIPELENYSELSKIIQNATAKNPEERYKSCEEFIINLEEYTNGEIPIKIEETIIEEVEEVIIDEEEKEWEYALETNYIELYKDYLKKHPNGKYRDIAKEKLNKLIKAETAKAIVFIFIPILILIIYIIANQ